MAEGNSFCDLLQADTTNTADSTGKVLINHLFGETNCLEDSGRLIRLQGRDTHLGCNLNNAHENSLIVIVDGRMIILIQDALVDQFSNAFLCQIRIDCTRAKAQKSCKLMHFPRFSGLQDQGDCGTLLGTNQMLFHRRNSQKGRHGNMVLIDATIRQNDDIVSTLKSTVHLNIELLQSMLQRGILVIEDRNGCRTESRLIKRTNLQNINTGQNRMVDLKYSAVLAGLFE